MWRTVWSLDGPPKMRHFLWSACKGNMAVRDRLVHRHITSITLCPICGAASETIIHSLFECEAAISIWRQCDIASCLVGAPSTTFADRWLWLARKCSAKELCYLASLMWDVWRCRNLIFFDNDKPNFVMIAAGFKRLVEEYQEYSKKVFASGMAGSTRTSIGVG